jgi:hypothetical protein
MKAYIGPFKYWWGPYQIADLLQKVGVSEDRCHSIGEWLADTPLMGICEWIEKKRPPRKEIVKLHKYDHWNAYHTIAIVALPVMEALREHKCSAGFIEDEDVPEELRSGRTEKEAHFGETDDNFFDRYNWALDEVIHALDKIVNDDCGDWDFNTEERERVQNGCRLFGKYFMTFWD